MNISENKLNLLLTSIAVLLIAFPMFFSDKMLASYLSSDGIVAAGNLTLFNGIRILSFLTAIIILFRNKISAYVQGLKLEFEKKIFLSLIAVYLLLLFFHLFAFNSMFDVLFNFNSEANLPTWFSTAQLLAAGILGLYIFGNSEKGTAFSRSVLIFSVSFLALSADELSQIHDKVGMISGIRWYIIFIPLLLMIGLLAGSSILKALKENKGKDLIKGIIIGLSIMMLGAIGLEIVGDYFFFISQDTLLYNIEVVFEESLEFLGESFILLTIFKYLRTNNLIRIPRST